MTVAGAQLKDITLKEAKEMIKSLLLRMRQEGEL